MSLFGNDKYKWRETYFVLFRQSDHPAVKDVSSALETGRNKVTNVNAVGEGRFESATVESSEDHSGMDVTFVAGDEVREHVQELLNDFAKQTLSSEDQEKLNLLGECDSRFDIFHFEEIDDSAGDAEESLDPGALLLVIEQIVYLCKGVGIDPQSGSLIT
jgi:hypothetical protein